MASSSGCIVGGMGGSFDGEGMGVKREVALGEGLISIFSSDKYPS